MSVDSLRNQAVCAVLLLIGYAAFYTHWRRPYRGNDQNEIKQGDKLGQVSSYDWGRYERTLLLAIRTGCHHCEESVGFYTSLTNVVRSHYIDVHLLAVLPNSEPDVHKFLNAHNLIIDTICPFDLGDLNIKATPTLLLVDRHGRVLRAWVGHLRSEGEADVFRSIGVTKVFGDSTSNREF